MRRFVLLATLAVTPLWSQPRTLPAPSPAPDATIELFPAVIVSATGYGEEPLAMPYSTAVLTSQWLDERLPRTLPGALSELPGLMVQKTAYAQGSPYIRGFTGFRTLLLVDGIRINNSVFREGPNQYWGTVDPLGLERLEIVKGSSSVIYGSDAVGGTVNAIAGGATSEATAATGGRILYRYSSAEDSHTARLSAGTGIGNGLSARAGVSYKRYGDLRAGEPTGVQPHTGYEESAFDGHLNYRLTEGVDVSALFQSVKQDDAWRTHATMHGLTWRGTRPGSDRQRSLDQSRRLFAVQLRARGLRGPIDQVQASVSVQSQQEDQLRLRNDLRREDTGFDATTGGTFVQLQSPSAIGRWVYGAEFYRDWVDSYSVRYRADGVLQQIDIQGPVAGKATYDLAGGYIENRLPPMGPVDLVAGGRYNRAAADARRVRDPLTGNASAVSGDWHSFVGSLRGVIHLDSPRRSNVFAGISESFRAPNLSDLTRFDIAEGGQIETPAPNLEPENFLTYEFGLRTRQARWSAEVAFFHTSIRNQIIRTPTGAIVDGLAEVTKRNSGAGYVHGVELAGSVKLGETWSCWGNFTWMRGELDYYPTASASLLARAPMSRVMPPTAHAGVRWSPRRQLWVELAGSAADQQVRLAPNDKVDIERIPPDGTPGYAIASLRIGWRASDRLRIFGAIENLADRDYRIHGSGLNEPGRNFVFSAELRF